jgi:hypothetical protein
MMLWRNHGFNHPQEGRYLVVPPSHRMFAPQMVMEEKVVKMRMIRPMGEKMNKWVSE